MFKGVEASQADARHQRNSTIEGSNNSQERDRAASSNTRPEEPARVWPKRTAHRAISWLEQEREKNDDCSKPWDRTGNSLLQTDTEDVLRKVAIR